MFFMLSLVWTISRNDTSRFTLLYLVDWIITIDIISCAQFVPKNKHIPCCYCYFNIGNPAKVGVKHQ